MCCALHQCLIYVSIPTGTLHLSPIYVGRCLFFCMLHILMSMPSICNIHSYFSNPVEWVSCIISFQVAVNPSLGFFGFSQPVNTDT